MSISIKDVETMARLAKLSFSDEEKEKFVQQFNQILQYMDTLNELDTDNIEPTTNAVEAGNVMRPDEVETWLSQEDATANAPRSKHGYFSVPKVIG